MEFLTDQQTLDDLAIFGKKGRGSVYDLFRTNTSGGALLLKKMLDQPLVDADEINRRTANFRYFGELQIGFPFRKEWFDAVECYLKNRDKRTRVAAEGNTLERKMRKLSGQEWEYELFHKGVLAGIKIVKKVAVLLREMEGENVPEEFRGEYERMKDAMQDPNIIWALRQREVKKLTYAQMVEYDPKFRFEGYEKWRQLLHGIYCLDVYVSVSRVMRERGFVFGEALPAEANVLHVDGMYHPLLEKAVPNTLHADGQSHVIFLTGANMAGKSTFMKAFAITFYLAHAGFPLPVSRMKFSVRKGIYTTINLPDKLDLGYSHFYAEVLRVRKVAERVRHVGNLVVVFDELFRGTNVKDAHDALVAVTEAFATRRDSLFLISSHIIEAGEVLRERCGQMKFVCLPTIEKAGKLVYPYTLEEGITNDRYGMAIIHNAQVIELLENTQRREVKSRAFSVDKQTLMDLHILGKFEESSIFNVFNRTCTAGGLRLLEQMFLHPLVDAKAINERGDLFEFFQMKGMCFPFSGKVVECVERYAGIPIPAVQASAYLKTVFLKLFEHAMREKQYALICTGISDTALLLEQIADFYEVLTKEYDVRCAGIVEELKAILENPWLQLFRKGKGKQSGSVADVARYDYLLRYRCRGVLKRLLSLVYALDVYVSVASAANERGFARAWAREQEAGENGIEIQGVFHPHLPGSVGNAICLDHGHNVLFLTGANMAGKSTLMKAFGIAVYLAHMGFPVAAEKMEFSVQDGLYSSINVSDHLEVGYSHFYAEVARVKRVAEEVASGKNLVVIFDELFKGTNVKDAYDATVAVTKAFSVNRNCLFVVSTHITEAGEALAKAGDHFKFAYLPTVLQGRIPTYTYKLQEGITNDRHGMMIINNERIVDIIRGK